MKPKSSFSKIFGYALTLLLVIFLISTLIIGGDALSGKIENNKYYVWDAIRKTNERGEPFYKEVSKTIYMFSLILAYLLLAIMPIFLFLKIKEYLIKKIKSYRRN